MPNFFHNVSDETLFLNMTHGDKSSQAVLLHRYERIGFQYVGQMLRKNNLKNYQDIDFIDLIDETIYKAFRYYRVGEAKFSTFCSGLLNQALSTYIGQLAVEQAIEKESVLLDQVVGGTNPHTFHEYVSDTTQLSSSNQTDINLFLELLDGPINEDTKKILKVYFLFSQGLSIKEISRILKLSMYDARTSLSKAKSLFNHSDTIKLK